MQPRNAKNGPTTRDFAFFIQNHKKYPVWIFPLNMFGLHKFLYVRMSEHQHCVSPSLYTYPFFSINFVWANIPIFIFEKKFHLPFIHIGMFVPQ